MSGITLSGLFIYPIKSLGGLALREAALTPRGLRHDRRWLLVDDDARFLTQREHPEMALLSLEAAYNGFVVRHRQRPELLPLYVPFEATPDKTLFVRIWDDLVFAWRGAPQADAWFSEALGRACRLVYMSDMARREVEPEKNPPGTLVSFADSYPYLLTSEESLARLNDKLTEPVPMDRFRPNLVVRGAAPDAEMSWHRLRVGGHEFRSVDGCGRCVVTTIDQTTALKNPLREPLRTLATYRQRGSSIKFGQNVTGPVDGHLRLGDAVEIRD